VLHPGPCRWSGQAPAFIGFIVAGAVDSAGPRADTAGVIEHDDEASSASVTRSRLVVLNQHVAQHHRAAGIKVPQFTGAQIGAGCLVGCDDLQPYDLVLFPGHDGMYIGNGQMGPAPHTGQARAGRAPGRLLPEQRHRCHPRRGLSTRGLCGGLGRVAPRQQWCDVTEMACASPLVSATGADLRTRDALDAVAGQFLRWFASDTRPSAPRPGRAQLQHTRGPARRLSTSSPGASVSTAQDLHPRPLDLH